VLAVPAGAAWMKLSEAVDYLHTVQPRVAVPVHDYQDVFAGMAYHVLERCGPAGTTVTVLEAQRPTEV
jgi:hypothetical protein